MRSTIVSLILGLVIVASVGFGGYYIVKKLRADADVNVTPTTLSADLNGDGEVNALDLSIMTNAMSSGEANSKYDLNRDGKLNSLDLNILLNQYSK